MNMHCVEVDLVDVAAFIYVTIRSHRAFGQTVYRVVARGVKGYHCSINRAGSRSQHQRLLYVVTLCVE